MIKCLKCNNKLDLGENTLNKDIKCYNCDSIYKNIEGIICFDEANIVNDYYFTETALNSMHAVEQNHFFHVARRRILLYLFKKYLNKNMSIIDMGCGNGEMSQLLIENGYTVDCAEIFLAGLKICKSRFETRYFQMNLNKNPFENEYDALISIDVLEHLEDDISVLKGFYKSAKKGGIIIIVVPAYMFLWSDKDEYDCHKRRYSRKELVEKVKKAGFTIVKTNSFNTLLLPLMIAVRSFRKVITLFGFKKYAIDEERINPIINNIFNWIFYIEFQLFKHTNLPVGGSIVVVAKK